MLRTCPYGPGLPPNDSMVIPPVRYESTPMEHRCGTRFPLSTLARLHVSTGDLMHGRIGNVSLSGAFIAIPARVPVWTRLEVELASQASGSVPAYVVRETDGGVGLEWCELAPWPILRLLRQVCQADQHRTSSYACRALINRTDQWYVRWAELAQGAH
jgi:PilZ domain